MATPGTQPPPLRTDDLREHTILEVAVLLAIAAVVLLVAKVTRRPAVERPAVARVPARISWAKWAGGIAFCLCVAAIAFVVGAMSGFDTRPTRPCVTERTGNMSPQAYRDPENDGIVMTWRAFPPSTVCTWPDGTKVELVPRWINALLFASLGGAVVLTGGAVVTAWRARRQ
ncbi:hypothetical protein [Streptomyces sp. AK02-01A]|uniref:hypothetical protein n=1 Tax=Streptomyces sp. AK02-01A TaxID=3028648 RepID=UPI0029BECB42|nr:hypothetical protein [Streptomyces sp. AK02-01A]MDX3850370.1 hypothetical protein [Streptomyces sp. AK02-01A]